MALIVAVDVVPVPVAWERLHEWHWSFSRCGGNILTTEAQRAQRGNRSQPKDMEQEETEITEERIDCSLFSLLSPVQKIAIHAKN